MKKFTFTTLFMALAMSASAQAPLLPAVSPYGLRIQSGGVKLNHRSQKVQKAATTPTVEELLGCPQGTVYGGEYDEENSPWTGTYSADDARQDMRTSFFQYFTDNYYTFSGVRFVGTFNYFDADSYNWMNCDSRGEIDRNGEMTEPIRIHVGFWDVNEKGLPGKEVWGKDFDIIGENTGIVRGDDQSGYNYLYSFSADLGETIKMEHGFMQITAVDMQEDVSCYLALFTCGSSKGYGLVRSQYAGESDYSWMGCDPTVFCFKGDGSYIAKKAVKVASILAPESDATGKYTKVRVRLENVGSDAVANPVLQLMVDGKAVATETVNATIGNLDSYEYTFTTRADLSAAGTHRIEVKNVTPGDEMIAEPSVSVSTTTYSPSAYGESKSDECTRIYMTGVQIGDIDNQTDGTNYSDYTAQKTTIHAGDKLTLKVGFNETYAAMSKAAAWIDWNNDGMFDEKTEAVAFSEDDNTTATVTVPEGMSLTPGEKRMRVITTLSYDTPHPTGTYDYGETEDYTIVLAANEGKASGSLSAASVDETVEKGGVQNVGIDIANAGTATMAADIKVGYILPNAPTADIASDELTVNSSAAAQLKVRRAPAASRAAAPQAADGTQYVLKYDKGQYDVIGLGNYQQCTYATYYPGSMVESLKGMAISSVDVYLGAAAGSSSIVIYGANDQKHNGALIAEKAFATTPNAWNHVVLDKPVTIGGSDLWIGVKLSGFKEGDYNMGIDAGSAVPNYGDRVNIGGETWWSMSELGINSNYTIRANVTGERTPAIDWLSVDRDNVSVAGGHAETLGVKLDASKLDEGLYEAYIQVKTDDELLNTVTVPVYLQNGTATGIVGKDVMGGASVRFSANGVEVNADRQIAAVEVRNVAGAMIASAGVEGTSCTLGFSAPKHTVYIVTVKYADGTKCSVKVPAL